VQSNIFDTIVGWWEKESTDFYGGLLDTCINYRKEVSYNVRNAKAEGVAVHRTSIFDDAELLECFIIIIIILIYTVKV
jgi:hypothetical protein